MDEGEKTEYTRALHAEENAFFQASRNTNTELIGATLYTTDKTCNLCAKKAYQLGISRIVYIDNYSDISIPQTLEVGLRRIEVDRFMGITGPAYFKLYVSLMPEKELIKIYDT
jgi:deoxycytidylate deaminase